MLELPSSEDLKKMTLLDYLAYFGIGTEFFLVLLLDHDELSPETKSILKGFKKNETIETLDITIRAQILDPILNMRREAEKTMGLVTNTKSGNSSIISPQFMTQENIERLAGSSSKIRLTKLEDLLEEADNETITLREHLGIHWEIILDELKKTKGEVWVGLIKKRADKPYTKLTSLGKSMIRLSIKSLIEKNNSKKKVS